MAKTITNQKEIVELIKRISGQANILTIPRIYIDILDGDINAALILSQLVYWSDRGGRADGWIYKSYREWTEETSLSQYQVSRACDMMAKLGLIEKEIRLANASPTVHYLVNLETLTNTIIKFLNNPLSRNSIIHYEETSQSIMKKLDNPLSRNLINDYQETSQSLTEITTEITAETNTETSSSNPDDDEINFYENNIGICTPIILGKLETAIKDYPDGWVHKAIEVAAENRARSWAYIEKVLDNWKINGFGWKPGELNQKEKESEENYRRYTEGEFAEFVH